MKRSLFLIWLFVCSLSLLAATPQGGSRAALEDALRRISAVEPLLGVYDLLVKYGLEHKVPILCPIYEEYQVSSPYGWRLHPVDKVQRFHSGIDMSAPLATFVHASADGVVVHSGRKGGYGQCIILRHQYGFETLYGHLSIAYARYGSIVKAGEVIGFVGSTGVSTGNHLHYEIRKQGKAVLPVILDERLDAASRKGFELLRSRTAEKVTEETKKRHLRR